MDSTRSGTVVQVCRASRANAAFFRASRSVSIRTAAFLAAFTFLLAHRSHDKCGVGRSPGWSAMWMPSAKFLSTVSEYALTLQVRYLSFG